MILTETVPLAPNATRSIRNPGYRDWWHPSARMNRSKMVVCPTSHVRCGMTLVHAEPAGTCGGADRPERGLGGYDGGDERLTWKCRGLIPSCLWG